MADATIVYIEGRLSRPRVVTQSKPTIFLVEDRLRNVNATHYEPKKVSIGPIHHGKEQLRSMEEHKERLMQELIKELLDKKKDVTLEMLVEEVRKKEEDARRSYSESINQLNNGHDFLGTMILDGCFIIQLMRLYHSAKHGDPVLGSETLIQIIHDLLLFENQIPFCVLNTLFDKIKTGDPINNLSNLILFLVGDIVPWLDHSKAKLLPEPSHLLEFVYRCILTKIPPNPNSDSDSLIKLLPYKIASKLNCWEWGKSSATAKKSPVISISSASELKEVSGIRLQMSEDNILTFTGRVLRLPPLQVSGETEPLLRNLMAYEQLQLGDDHPRHVIDYVFLMHCLAKSTRDIEILRYRGIIKNYLGSDDQILIMIGRLGTHFMISPDYTYSDIFECLNKLCRNRRNEWMANLERTYFNTPWSAIKFVAATFLLVFAAAQVVFAVLSYSTQMNSPNKN